jgi:hypothetical protein
VTAPTREVRGQTMLRDGFRCLACGSRENLQWQHREASGHGGRGKKAPPLVCADGVILCEVDNNAAEADGQDRALALGWKIRRNRGGIASSEIPFFDTNDRTWYLPGEGAARSAIHFALALDLLDIAGNLRRKKALS